MLARQLIGRYAGEVRDMAPDVARQLIASGRALDVRVEVVEPVKGPPVKAKPPENVSGKDGQTKIARVDTIGIPHRRPLPKQRKRKQ